MSDTVRDLANEAVAAVLADPVFRAEQHRRCLVLLDALRPTFEELRGGIARLGDRHAAEIVVEIQHRLRTITEILNWEEWG